MPKNLQDVRAYQKAMKASDAISAILKRPAFSRELNLKDQLSRSSTRVGPLIAEGFGQLTDRHLAVYLGRARGSVLESIGHLHTCVTKGLLSPSEHSDLVEAYDHLGKMLTRWINYLQNSDWTDRG
ncbi:MAG: four helix bundle protein [Vicinamibacterales bacterium]|nr:four helix bundle protein [Vicinamibacterales bacterium]